MLYFAVKYLLEAHSVFALHHGMQDEHGFLSCGVEVIDEELRTLLAGAVDDSCRLFDLGESHTVKWIGAAHFLPHGPIEKGFERPHVNLGRRLGDACLDFTVVLSCHSFADRVERAGADSFGKFAQGETVSHGGRSRIKVKALFLFEKLLDRLGHVRSFGAEWNGSEFFCSPHRLKFIARFEGKKSSLAVSLNREPVNVPSQVNASKERRASCHGETVTLRLSHFNAKRRL